MNERYEVLADGDVVIDNVHIPLTVNEEFCTPDFGDAIEYYPHYSRHCLTRGQEPLTPFNFMFALCDAAASTNVRPGRKPSDFLRRIIEHFGIHWLKDQGIQPRPEDTEIWLKSLARIAKGEY